MKKKLLIIFCASFVLFGFFKKKNKPTNEEKFLNKVFEKSGSVIKYPRVETFSYSFTEVLFEGNQEKTETGNHYFRLHDENGFRASEKRLSSSGKILKTVIHLPKEQQNFSKDSFYQKPKEQPLREEFCWSFLPLYLKENNYSMNYRSSKFFQGTLTRLFEVTKSTGTGMSLLPSPFHLLIDSGTYHVNGVLFKKDEKKVSIELGDFVPIASFMIPSQRIYYDKNGHKTRIFKIHDIKINDYIDDSIFDLN